MDERGELDHVEPRSTPRVEDPFRTLIESMPDGVIVHRHGAIVYMSPSARGMLGYGSSDEVAGKPAMDLIHPEDRAAAIERMTKLRAGREVARAEQRLLRKSGGAVMVEVSAIPTMFEGEPAVLTIARDVSERKEMEARLLMADRLASIGRLAASVGHEINNPLAYVLGNVHLMRRELSSQPSELAAKLEERLKIIEEGSQRVLEIVRDLKTLARGDDGVGPVDLHRVLDVCANMAEHEIRYRARLVRDYEGDVFVPASEARLGQVFLNLLVNAGQAIPEGDVDGNEIRVTTRPSGPGRVLVEVHDTGTGIPEEVIEHIFDPFFTTKPVGSGTGLGLSICQHIVTSLGGGVSVIRSADRGTTFRVSLPTVPPIRPTEPPPPRYSSAPPASPYKVLVVDDEIALARTCAEALAGYKVWTAASGREALDLLNSGERFDAIVCDLVMSDVSGMEVYEYVRASLPEVEPRMVMMTAGAFTPRARELVESLPGRCLEKPFTPEMLITAVRKAIARARTSR